MSKLLLILLSSFISLNIQGHRLLPSLAKFLPENPVILEAGAYDGDYSLQMSELWPNGIIYAFEPVPLLFLKTKAKTFNRKNVRCFQFALSSQTGTASFYISSDTENEISRSSSLLEPKNHLTLYPTVKFNKRIDVPTINLDEWAVLNNVDHIDLMWLDMQGAEFNMLKAAPQILKTTKVIFIKIAFTETYKNIPLYSEVRPWLESQGFSVIFDEACGAAKAEGNALFIRNKMI
jgi:FkbM family methyltransferase